MLSTVNGSRLPRVVASQPAEKAWTPATRIAGRKAQGMTGSAPSKVATRRPRLAAKHARPDRKGLLHLPTKRRSGTTARGASSAGRIPRMIRPVSAAVASGASPGHMPASPSSWRIAGTADIFESEEVAGPLLLDLRHRAKFPACGRIGDHRVGAGQLLDQDEVARSAVRVKDSRRGQGAYRPV